MSEEILISYLVERNQVGITFDRINKLIIISRLAKSLFHKKYPLISK